MGCLCFDRWEAQTLTICAGTQAPLKYDAGLDFKFAKRFSVSAGAGVLTRPYDKAILNIIEAFGLEEGYVNMISNAFSYGMVYDGGIRFHYRKNYFGVYAQYINLAAQDAPQDLVESYLGIDLSPYRKPKPFVTKNIEVALESNLLQLGVLYGRRFVFKNPKFEIRTELGISKNITSQSYFYIDGSKSESLSEVTNEELKPIYMDYAYIPTINLYLVYNLWSKKFPKN